MDTLKSTLVSSLALSIARSSSPAHARQNITKIKYTADELRRLNSPSLPRPADLRDMTVIVVPLSPRSLAVNRKGSSRFPTKPLRTTAPAKSRRGERSERGVGRTAGSNKYKQNRNQAPPPLIEGPIKPFVKSETRWVPSIEKEKPKDIANQVKTLLNKLTRDRFEKLTAEFCAIPLQSLKTLSTLIAMIMDKALEEPNFAEVYADLCARLHLHISQKRLPFLHAAYHVDERTWYWTAANQSRFPGFHGPVSNQEACFAAVKASSASELETGSIPADQFQEPSLFMDKKYLIAIATKAGQPQGLFYSAVQLDSLGDDEPYLGSYASEELALKAAVKLTSFKRLLVTRCQDKFDSSEHKAKATDEEAIRLAKRTKTLMLGNMRFLGELFKVELIAESVIQSCIFKLLGLELVNVNGTLAAQTIRMPDEEDVEALCKVLTTVGKKLDHEGNTTTMTMIVVRSVELSESPALNSRTRFLLKDVLEMRDYQWVPRRKELQQKTLQEVRKEAEKLQKLGKNAQHDDLQGKRQRAAHSSQDVAKQNSTLLLRTEAPVVDPTNRIKSILNEYLTLLDINETRQCVAELSRENHVAFVEQALTLALEGKEKERAAAVDMLVGLYETLHLGATEIQSGLLGTLEFLDDLRIDIPMIHEYCGHIVGRLIAVGCFGLSWLQAGIGHLAESGLAAKLLAEVLSVLEAEMGLDMVAVMIPREELAVTAFLPSSQQSPEAVAAYLKANDLESFFDEGGDEDDEEVKDAIVSTIQEYFTIQDLGEVDTCFDELPSTWPVAFVKVTMNLLCECKESQRDLMVKLVEHELGNGKVQAQELDIGLSWWLELFEDVLIDVPQAAVYVAPVLALVLQKHLLSFEWLVSVLQGPSRAAGLLVEATCGALDALTSHESTVGIVQASVVPVSKITTDEETAARLSRWLSQ
ncbi:unnamed protein product [Aphanomyces euteiches]